MAEDPLDALELKIQSFIDKKDYESAQKLLDQELDYFNDPSWKRAQHKPQYWKQGLHELWARILHASGCEDDAVIRRVLDPCKVERQKDDPQYLYVDDDKQYDFMFLDTKLVFGSLLMREKGQLRNALQAMKYEYDECKLLKADEVKRYGLEPVMNGFQTLIKKIELQLAQETESAAHDLLMEEEKSTKNTENKRSRNKKKNEKKKAKKAALAKELESKFQQQAVDKPLQQDEEEKGLEGEFLEEENQKEKEVSKPSEDTKNEGPSKFPVEFDITLDVKSGDQCHIGFIVSQGSDSKLSKSFVEATKLHLQQLENLADLCSQHESLVTVECAVSNPNAYACKFLVTEVVYSVNEFFNEEYKLWEKTCATPSKEEWWKHIASLFWTIFRDIARGLMYLFKNKKACGNLFCSVFVTPGGRGKILPNLNPENKPIIDIMQLKDMMLSAVFDKFWSERKDHSFLPAELAHFFKFTEPDQMSIPPIFWVAHVYFLSKGERIDFPLKLKKLLHENWFIKDAMEQYLDQNNYFIQWYCILQVNVNSVYYRVWLRGNKDGGVKPYNSASSISRFYGAVYNHANDRDYKEYRPKRKLDNEELERSLSNFFPDFYKNMFESLCHCCTLLVNSEDRRVISNFLIRDEGVKVGARSFLGKSMTFNMQENLALEVYGIPECLRSLPSVKKFDPSILRGSLKTLCDMAQCMTHDKQIILDMPNEIVDSEAAPLYIGKEEIEHFLERAMIGAVEISLYIRFLYHDCIEKGLTSSFGFLNPYMLAEIGENKNSRAEYIRDVFIAQASENKLFLAPCHFSLHWVLCVIAPSHNTVYYLDSAESRIPEDTKETIYSALSMFHHHVGKSSINDTTWIEIQCPSQDNATDCGYFVLMFMRDIIYKGQNVIPKKFIPVGTIDQVREEWANYLLDNAHFVTSKE